MSSCPHSVGDSETWRVGLRLDKALMMDPGFQTEELVFLPKDHSSLTVSREVFSIEFFHSGLA